MDAPPPDEHIPPSVVNHLLRRLAVEFADRDRVLAQAVATEVSQANARGMVASGPAVAAVVAHYTAEARLRTRQTRLCLQQAMAALGGSQRAGFADAAMVVLRPILAEQSATMRARMLDAVPLKWEAKSSGRNDREVAALEAAFRTAETELRLDLDEIEGAARQMAERPGGNSVGNITGDGNVVVVGITSAEVSIRLDGPAKDAIAAAMKAVLDGLDASGLPAEKAAEIRELATECADLAAQEKPNKTKLGGMLKAISESIRTVGAMQSASQGVKAALAYLGLSGGV